MKKIIVVMTLLLLAPNANAFEIFVKGNVSKSYLSTSNDEWTLSSSGAFGIAFALFSGLRIEGRYTSAATQQSLLESEGATFSDIRTLASIYTVSLEVALAGDRAAFQPYFAVGAGYIERTQTFNVTIGSETIAGALPARRGVSANAGLGVRMRVGKNIALELEAVGWATNPHVPGALVDWDAKAGLRLFL